MLASYLAAEHLLRTDPIEDHEGFFIALFVKKSSINDSEEQTGIRNTPRALTTKKPHFKRHSHANRKFSVIPAVYSGVFKIWNSRLVMKRRIRRTKGLP